MGLNATHLRTANKPTAVKRQPRTPSPRNKQYIPKHTKRTGNAYTLQPYQRHILALLDTPHTRVVLYCPRCPGKRRGAK